MATKIVGDEFGARWKKIARHTDQEIFGFFGHYRFLSNMWPQEVLYETDWYPSNENAYQAAKFRKSHRSLFLTCTPQEAKRLGQDQAGRMYSNSEWGWVKIPIMAELSLCKFSYHSDMKAEILATDKAVLVEGNWWNDTFWGVYVDDQGNETGDNNLGKIHMRTRDLLIQMLD